MGTHVIDDVANTNVAGNMNGVSNAIDPGADDSVLGSKDVEVGSEANVGAASIDTF